MPTCQPNEAKAAQIARPMPPEAPVTKTPGGFFMRGIGVRVLLEMTRPVGMAKMIMCFLVGEGKTSRRRQSACWVKRTYGTVTRIAWGGSRCV